MEAVPRPADSPSNALAERWQRWRSDPRAGIAVLLCVAVAAGVAWFRAGIVPASPPKAGRSSSSDPSSKSASRPTAPLPNSTTSTTTTVLVVDVVGAVHKAGVVTLPGGSRVVDAVAAAGGAVAGADLTRLNLAAVLDDGARVAVPFVGQPSPAVDPTAVTGASGNGAAKSGGEGVNGGGTEAPINVNTATADELEALPGVGPATAAAIIQERDSNGPFATVDDLDRVRGIGPAKLAQLHDLVTV